LAVTHIKLSAAVGIRDVRLKAGKTTKDDKATIVAELGGAREALACNSPGHILNRNRSGNAIADVKMGAELKRHIGEDSCAAYKRHKATVRRRVSQRAASQAFGRKQVRPLRDKLRAIGVEVAYKNIDNPPNVRATNEVAGVALEGEDAAVGAHGGGVRAVIASACAGAIHADQRRGARLHIADKDVAAAHPRLLSRLIGSAIVVVCQAGHQIAGLAGKRDKTSIVAHDGRSRREVEWVLRRAGDSVSRGGSGGVDAYNARRPGQQVAQEDVGGAVRVEDARHDIGFGTDECHEAAIGCHVAGRTSRRGSPIDA
jgi:hypothetical protein